MRIILLGAPGVGKGTQGNKLADFFNVSKLSTGEMLRKEISLKSELGITVSDILRRGMLVPDAIVEGIVLSNLKNPLYRSGFILDGFPRTLHQAEFLCSALEALPKDNLFILNIFMSEAKLINRLQNRLLCKRCGHTMSKLLVDDSSVASCEKCKSEDLYQRDDDNYASVVNRLRVYNELTRPLIEYYRSFDKWIEVDGDGAIDYVFNIIVDLIRHRIS